MLLAAGGASDDRTYAGDEKYRESYEWTIRESSDHGFVLRIDKRVFSEEGIELGRFTVEISLPGPWTRPPEGA